MIEEEFLIQQTIFYEMRRNLTEYAGMFLNKEDTDLQQKILSWMGVSLSVTLLAM